MTDPDEDVPEGEYVMVGKKCYRFLKFLEKKVPTKNIPINETKPKENVLQADREGSLWINEEKVDLEIALPKKTFENIRKTAYLPLKEE